MTAADISPGRTVGIVTPTVNAERYLEETLRSVWSQATAGISIDHLVVDGGSTDRTVEIA
jgi:glycosyltransferase involved in cell wall biosynthesis